VVPRIRHRRRLLWRSFWRGKVARKSPYLEPYEGGSEMVRRICIPLVDVIVQIIRDLEIIFGALER
jgi:hypothetical protein